MIRSVPGSSRTGRSTSSPTPREPTTTTPAGATLSPEETQLRLSQGRVCFNWYRISVTIPERVGDFDPTRRERRVRGRDRRLRRGLGQRRAAARARRHRRARGRRLQRPQPRAADRRRPSGPAVPDRGVRDQRPDLGLAAQLHLDAHRDARLLRARTGARGEAAELEVERADAELDSIVAPDATLERVAGGFVFTEGPVWSPDGALLFSSPNTNVIYRWHPAGRVSVFRSKSGYSGIDIGRFTQPGSNGLTFDPQGRLTICQHGNRRVIRVEPHGNVTVLADRFDGRRLNSPNDLVYRSDGTLFFTDPPFGLPGVFDDPDKELPFSGVFAVRDGG